MYNSFTWFDKIGEVVAKLPEEQGMRLAYALSMYGAAGVEPDFGGDVSLECVFIALKENIDYSVASRENGRKGGRPKSAGQKVSKGNEPAVGGDAKPVVNESGKPVVLETRKPVVSEKRPKNEKPIQNNTVHNNTKEIYSPAQAPDAIPYAEIVGSLNAKAGTAYRSDGRKTRSLIAARWREGFRLADFNAVIDAKCAEWRGDPSMSRYLRPETLFGTKFEGYLQTAPIAAEAKAGSSLSASHRPDYGKEGW